MANKRLWLGMLVMVLVFGMTVVGCADSNLDSKLNGTWDIGNGYITKYKNGEWETSFDGVPSSRGTYTTKDNTLTETGIFNYGDWGGLESKWYTRDEFIAHTSGIDVHDYFGPWTSIYSISGDTLTETFESGEPIIATRIKSGTATRITKITSDSKESNRGSTKIKEKNLVGVWELENFENISRRELSDKDEFFKDGTGIMTKGNQNVSFTWRLRDGNRLQMDAGMSGTQICVIELSEKGRYLTYYYDEQHKKALYRKK